MSLAGTSLKYSNVKPVSGRICAFCVFTNGSTAKGCSITLYSDQITFHYTIPRNSTYDIALVECFNAAQSGSYHVLVSEILMDGSEGYNTLELPDITVELASATDNTSKKENGRLYHNQTSIQVEIFNAFCRHTNSNWTFRCPWSNTYGLVISHSTCLYLFP